MTASDLEAAANAQILELSRSLFIGATSRGASIEDAIGFVATMLMSHAIGALISRANHLGEPLTPDHIAQLARVGAQAAAAPSRPSKMELH